MAAQIQDCKIKPLQPGDLCQRALVCQQQHMQKYQRELRVCVCVHTCVYTCKHAVSVFIHFVCIPDCVSFFPSPLLAASVSVIDLRIVPGLQGSCLDCISNQCYTSCVLASATFNTARRKRQVVCMCGKRYG